MFIMGVVSLCSLALSAYLYTESSKYRNEIESMKNHEKAKSDYESSVAVQKLERDTKSFVSALSSMNDKVRYIKDTNGNVEMYDKDFVPIEVGGSLLSVISSKEFNTDNVVYSYEKLYKVMNDDEVLDLGEELERLPSSLISLSQVSIGDSSSRTRKHSVENTRLPEYGSVVIYNENDSNLRFGSFEESIWTPIKGHAYSSDEEVLTAMNTISSTLTMKASESFQIVDDNNRESVNIMFSDRVLERLNEKKGASIVVNLGFGENIVKTIDESKMALDLNGKKTFKSMKLEVPRGARTFNIKIATWTRISRMREVVNPDVIIFEPYIHIAYNEDGSFRGLLIN